MKTLLQKYKHAWVFLYGLIYLPSFFYLEKTITRGYHIIHIPLDDKIPFIEYFIAPYLLWFGFIAVTVLYFFFADKTEFYQVTAFMIIGMTVFLIVSAIYPNGQMLRPKTFEHNNIFITLVKQLYRADTPTNIFPSIHVYNSIGAYIAIRHSKRLKHKRGIQCGALLLTVLIILSTVFLKQHSILDVIGAGVLAFPAYHLAYNTQPRWKQVHRRIPA